MFDYFAVYRFSGFFSNSKKTLFLHQNYAQNPRFSAYEHVSNRLLHDDLTPIIYSKLTLLKTL